MSVTNYYEYPFDVSDRGWGGTRYFKWTSDIEQEGTANTNILMTLSKTTNSDGTLYYGITWLNQIYRGSGGAETLYNEYVFSPQTKRLDRLTPLDPESGLTDFIQVYNSLFSYINGQASSLIPTSTLYQAWITPTYMQNQQNIWILANSKSDGSLVQVTWNSFKNYNLLFLNLIIGNRSQTNENPIQRSWSTWYGQNPDPYGGDTERITEELAEFNHIISSQAEARDLYPIWSSR